MNIIWVFFAGKKFRTFPYDSLIGMDEKMGGQVKSWEVGETG